MANTLNTDLLSGMLKEKRGSKGLRTVADEIGNLSFATLSRIEQGKVPDVDTFIRICKWLGVSSDTFILGDSNQKAISSKEQVVAHLRADRELTKETINMLISVIHLAYNSK